MPPEEDSPKEEEGAPPSAWEILDVLPGQRHGFVVPRVSDAAQVIVDSEVTDALWEEFAGRYRATLLRLGVGDRDAFLERMARLEIDALEDDQQRRLPRILKMELEVAKALAGRDPEALVPLMELHHDLYAVYRDAEQWYLLHHSVAMVKALAELYVAETRSPGSRIVAARVLASLAGQLQEGRQPSSLRLFEDALSLDPGNEASLLGIVAHFEKRGTEPKVVKDQLGRLLKAHPEHREGRLRMAVNLRRLERFDEATVLFAALLAEPADDWIFRLAAQESARVELLQGHLAAAIEILEDALKQVPDDQKLRIQLAFCHDKNRDSRDARRQAEAATAATPATEAPRGRYNQWPTEALAADRMELRRMSESRTELLVRELGGLGGGP